MAKKKWKEIWESGIVFDTAEDWETEDEWLEALSNEVGHEITDEAIGRAWRRWQKKLDLPLLPEFSEVPVVSYPDPAQPSYTWFEAMKKRLATTQYKRILCIPDPQIKPGFMMDHIIWAAKYAVDKRPDIIVHEGDFADMPSLSSYDKGKASGENRRYSSDIEAANAAANAFMKVIRKAKGYNPRIVITLGNHEERILRAANDQAHLAGTLSMDDLDYARLGWEVVPFLKTIEIEGILFSHFFPRSSSGAIVQTKRGAPSASAQVKREMQSSVSGHKQGLDQAIYNTGNRTCRGIIAGSYYCHDESYMTEDGNNHWRGILMLNRVHDGNFDVTEISLEYLYERYGQ